MKRFACTLLCGALLLTFAGCGKEETKELTEKETAQTTEESVQATETTETTEPEEPQMDLETATATYETVWVTKDDFCTQTEQYHVPGYAKNADFLLRFSDQEDLALLLQYSEEQHNGSCRAYAVWCRGQYAEIDIQVSIYEGLSANTVLVANDMTAVGTCWNMQVFTETDNAPFTWVTTREGEEVLCNLNVEDGRMHFSMSSKRTYAPGKYDKFLDSCVSRDEFYSVEGTVGIADSELQYREDSSTYQTVSDGVDLENELYWCQKQDVTNSHGKPYSDFSSVDEILAYNAAVLQ